ncbi:MAG: transposase family protein [Cyanobacteria bacterium J06639_1]
MLIALEYWRDTRAYFHIAQTWQVSEATVCRIVRRVEEALELSGQCQLPGKTRLRDPSSELSLVLVDVMESPIERPKKTKALLQR